MSAGDAIPVVPELFFYAGVFEPPGWHVRGVAGLVLPGVDEWKRRFSADRRAPDELAALYDDLTHSMRTNKQLFELGLEDVCRVQLELYG
jgi:hypothetical protein